MCFFEGVLVLQLKTLKFCWSQVEFEVQKLYLKKLNMMFFRFAPKTCFLSSFPTHYKSKTFLFLDCSSQTWSLSQDPFTLLKILKTLESFHLCGLYKSYKGLSRQMFSYFLTHFKIKNVMLKRIFLWKVYLQKNFFPSEKSDIFTYSKIS